MRETALTDDATLIEVEQAARDVGTHAVLMDRGGLYDNLYTMQWKGQGDLAAD